MFEQFALSVTKENMPWVVRQHINREGWDLVEIQRFGWGTPDGECDTEVWDLTQVCRAGRVVTFVRLVYTTNDCLALPAIEEVVYMEDWLEYGTKFTTKFDNKGGCFSKEDRVPIDHSLVKRILQKETLEVA